jgi:hypothetical protein
MASWFPQSVTRAQVCRRTSPVPPDERTIVTRNFVYSATPTTTAYPDDTIPFATFEGIDQLVVSGTIPAPNTIIYMPPATALLDLFKDPEVDDQFSFDVSNHGANSIDLTIYKVNSYGTGQPGVVYQNPMRIATIPAHGAVRLYLRIVNATQVAGVADVKMMTVLEGGTYGSMPPPSILFNMGVALVPLVPTVNNAQLMSQHIVPSIVGPPYQLQFGGTAAAPGTILPPAVPAGASCAAFLYPTDRTGVANLGAPPLVGGLVAGRTFEFTLYASNNSGQTLTWTAGAATGVTLTGISPVAQVTGTTYRVDFLFTIAGVSTTTLPWVGSTVTINLTRVDELNPTFTTVTATTGAITTVNATTLNSTTDNTVTLNASSATNAVNVTNVAGWVGAPQYQLNYTLAVPTLVASSIGYTVNTTITATTIVNGAAAVFFAQVAPSAIGVYLVTYYINVPATGVDSAALTHGVGVAATIQAGTALTAIYIAASWPGFITNTSIVSLSASSAISVMAGKTTGTVALCTGMLRVTRIA